MPLQEIKSLEVNQHDMERPMLSALAARAARQQGKIPTVGYIGVHLDNTETALEELTSLMEKI